MIIGEFDKYTHNWKERKERVCTSRRRARQRRGKLAEHVYGSGNKPAVAKQLVVNNKTVAARGTVGGKTEAGFRTK